MVGVDGLIYPLIYFLMTAAFQPQTSWIKIPAQLSVEHYFV